MQLKDYEDRVAAWLQECFPAGVCNSREERLTRFLEEALELVQSEGFDREKIEQVVQFVFDRPAGDPEQEVGGVMNTIAAYCWNAGIDLEHAAVTELVRIERPDVMAKIRAKHAAKSAHKGIVAASE